MAYTQNPFSKHLARTPLLLSTLVCTLTFALGVSAQQRSTASKITPIISYLLFSDAEIGAQTAPEEASRFLIQSTFGPTYDDIARLSNSSIERWLQTQYRLAPTKTVDYVESQNWLTNYPLIVAGSANSSLVNVMLNAPDQLRQRMAYALSQIFVVSRDVGNGIDERPLYYLDYYDLLVENAFGNYRDLLENVTKNSVMGFYLTLNLNAPAGTQVGPPAHPASFFVASPDENYAREVLQLFSIGLVELEIDGTPKTLNGESVPSYTQETVENFARVFTGWNYQSGDTPETSGFFNLGIPRNTKPMIGFDAFHDRGDLQAVLSAILLDEEARNGHKTMPNTFGKFKEPFIRQLALWRGLNARRRTSNNNQFGAYDDVFFERLKQFPLNAKSVFNFYQPDFSPPGPLAEAELLAPESQLIDSESVVSIATTNEEYLQRHHDNSGNSFANSSTRLLIDTGPLEALVPNNLRSPEDLIERLNLVFLGGSMSDEMRQILLDVHDPSLYLVEDKWEIAIDLANIIILSPQFMVQK